MKLKIHSFPMQEAIKLVQPSSKREGFSTIPDVKWEDVGGLHSIRNEFNLHIVRRIKYPEEYQVSIIFTPISALFSSPYNLT